jgi:hydroxymethylpyrimidine/phosphomethylpyrimidine kinase
VSVPAPHTVVTSVSSVPIAVTIAGSDSSGGAGIQADLKTFAALGVYGATVITALTAQNTRGVAAIHDVPADFVAAQIDAVFSDLKIDAVKIGMLSTAPTIETVAAALARRRPPNVVLDPVIIASTGASLLRPRAIDALRKLVGQADLLTPNLPEAAALLNLPLARDEHVMEVQAQKLLEFGAKAVLIKGGHGEGPESVDLLVDPGGCTRFAAPRIATKNTHGTGCSLSSAIAAGLAKGLPLAEAVGQAKQYVTAAIAAADRLGIGSGPGPLHHFHAWW